MSQDPALYVIGRPGPDTSRTDSPYSPQVGALVDMMAYARFTTVQAVSGMTHDELDAIPPGFSNSVAMLLAHIASVDRVYQYASFQGRWPTDAEWDVGAFSFGQRGERVQGRPLETLLTDLESSRAETLSELARRDDAWLASPLTVPEFDYPNHHWAWFHVMEDEVSHRGQMRVIRKAIRAQAAPSPD